MTSTALSIEDGADQIIQTYRVWDRGEARGGESLSVLYEGRVIMTLEMDPMALLFAHIRVLPVRKDVVYEGEDGKERCYARISICHATTTEAKRFFRRIEASAIQACLYGKQLVGISSKFKGRVITDWPRFVPRINLKAQKKGLLEGKKFKKKNIGKDLLASLQKEERAVKEMEASFPVQGVFAKLASALVITYRTGEQVGRIASGDCLEQTISHEKSTITLKMNLAALDRLKQLGVPFPQKDLTYVVRETGEEICYAKIIVSNAKSDEVSQFFLHIQRSGIDVQMEAKKIQGGLGKNRKTFDWAGSELDRVEIDPHSPHSQKYWKKFEKRRWKTRFTLPS